VSETMPRSPEHLELIQKLGNWGEPVHMVNAIPQNYVYTVTSSPTQSVSYNASSVIGSSVQ
jgi:hypothetical protein